MKQLTRKRLQEHRKKKRLRDDRNAWRSDQQPSDLEWNKKSKKPFVKPNSRRHSERLEKGIVTHVRKNVPKKKAKGELAKLLAGLSKDERHELEYLNPHACRLWAQYLNRAFERVKTSKQAHAVTLISDELNANVKGGWPDPEDVQELLGRYLQGFSYLMIVQVGFRRITDIEVNQSGYLRYKSRSLICFHAHGIIWGDDQVIKHRLSTLPPSLGAPGGVIQPLFNPLGWFLYSTEDPRCFETRVKRRLSRGYRPGIDQIPMTTLVKLVRHLYGYSKPGMCFAEGLGKRMLLRARFNARIARSRQTRRGATA